jgi:hypothetical protein
MKLLLAQVAASRGLCLPPSPLEVSKVRPKPEVDTNA